MAEGLASKSNEPKALVSKEKNSGKHIIFLPFFANIACLFYNKQN